MDAGERLVFDRAPLRIVLPVGRERIVSFPGVVALEVTEGFDALVRSQIIERNVYLRALVPFEAIRLTAIEIGSGRRIVLDLVAVERVAKPSGPVEISVAGDHAVAPEALAQQGQPTEPPAPLDMVALTRFAAQTVYAPVRLIPASPAVRQVDVDGAPVRGLYRGWRIETAPIGAWKSGALYVTAVRFTNQSDRAQDIDLQELRGRWLAATAQHGRVLAAGTDAAVTTVYLVCDRPFEACK